MYNAKARDDDMGCVGYTSRFRYYKLLKTADSLETCATAGGTKDERMRTKEVR